MSGSMTVLTPCRNAVEKRGQRGLQPLTDTGGYSQVELGQMGGRERLHLFGEPKGNPHPVARESAGVTRVVKALITLGVKTGNGSRAGGTCPTTVCKWGRFASAAPAGTAMK